MTLDRSRATRFTFVLRCFVAAALAAAAGAATAQAYPSKPIRIISPFAPGGGNEVICRAIATKSGETVMQPLVVEARPGANGIVGTEVAARAAPDGYTIVLNPSGHAVNASLYKKLPYDSIRDFTPISFVASSPLILVVHPTLPVKSVQELIALIPQEIVQRLNALIVAALNAPEVRERLTNAGVDPQSSTPEELARLMVSDVKRWAGVIERTGVQPQ